MPAKGTTKFADGTMICSGFQLPCPRRARPAGSLSNSPHHSFNYRAREGHDWERQTELDPPEVSTTVPAKGTTKTVRKITLLVGFQLPCPRRARRASKRPTTPYSGFQLPCPRRARPRKRVGVYSIYRFNYRAREGHDMIRYHLCKAELVSTTVPAKGTT